MKTQKIKNKSRSYKASRFDTTMETFVKRHDLDLDRNVRGDMKLGNYLEQKGYPSLSQMLEKS